MILRPRSGHTLWVPSIAGSLSIVSIMHHGLQSWITFAQVCNGRLGEGHWFITPVVLGRQAIAKGLNKREAGQQTLDCDHCRCARPLEWTCTQCLSQITTGTGWSHTALPRSKLAAHQTLTSSVTPG